MGNSVIEHGTVGLVIMPSKDVFALQEKHNLLCPKWNGNTQNGMGIGVSGFQHRARHKWVLVGSGNAEKAVQV